jgi:hypothetical protein
MVNQPLKPSIPKMDKTTRWMMDEHLQTETYRPFKLCFANMGASNKLHHDTPTKHIGKLT